MTVEIIQIVQEFSTAGGVESVAWELARAFDLKGIPNLVIASATTEVGTKVKRVAPWLSRVSTRGPLRHVGRILVVPVFTFAATRALRRAKGTVLSHGDSFRGDVLVVHAVNAESLAEKWRSGKWEWLLNPIHLWVSLRDRWMIGGLRYRMFVAVSARVAGELQRHYHVPPERIRIIPNGVNLERFNLDREAGLALRREFGIPATSRLLVFAGHEFHRKGLALVIQALKHLAPDVSLLVVGSDDPAPYRKLAAGIESRVIFAGPRYDMNAVYSAADAFVLPSAYETFSLVCMEAMACSVPVFAARAGGIEDYLEDGVNGFGIEMDAKDIADKIDRVLSDDVLLQKLRAGAHKTAQGYSWNQIASRYVELMDEVEASKRSPAPAPQPA